MELLKIFPEKEWDAVVEKIKSVNKVLLIGAVDCGKSTFAKYIIKCFLEKNNELVFIDSDVGQSSIAVPGVIALKKFSSMNLNLFADRLFFVGFTTPSVSLEKFINVFSDAVKTAESFKLPILVDTTGFVTGDGKYLKLRKIEILKPDLVVGFQRQNEIEHILKEITVSVFVLSPSKHVVQRSQEKRAEYRRAKFEQYFKNAESYIFPTRILVEEKQNKALIYHPENYRGKIVGVCSENSCLAVGYIEEIDDETVVVKTPLQTIKKVKKIIISKISVFSP